MSVTMINTLDASQCAIGTKGFLEIGFLEEIGGPDDFAWTKDPTVVLGDDRRWRGIHDGETLEREQPVYADWRSAIWATIKDLRQESLDTLVECYREIAEANETLRRAAMVEAWLEGLR